MVCVVELVGFDLFAELHRQGHILLEIFRKGNDLNDIIHMIEL